MRLRRERRKRLRRDLIALPRGSHIRCRRRERCRSRSRSCPCGCSRPSLERHLRHRALRRSIPPLRSFRRKRRLRPRRPRCRPSLGPQHFRPILPLLGRLRLPHGLRRPQCLPCPRRHLGTRRRLRRFPTCRRPPRCLRPPRRRRHRGRARLARNSQSVRKADPGRTRATCLPRRRGWSARLCSRAPAPKRRSSRCKA
jgi:hypothetical protein